jgi:putative acetyltransferase
MKWGTDIGKGLIEEGLKTIRSLGAEGCVLVGDPDFYCRFGYRHNPVLVLEGIPADCYKYFMCLPMIEQTPEGLVTHHWAFSVGL